MLKLRVRSGSSGMSLFELSFLVVLRPTRTEGGCVGRRRIIIGTSWPPVTRPNEARKVLKSPLEMNALVLLVMAMQSRPALYAS